MNKVLKNATRTEDGYNKEHFTDGLLKFRTDKSTENEGDKFLEVGDGAVVLEEAEMPATQYSKAGEKSRLTCYRVVDDVVDTETKYALFVNTQRVTDAKMRGNVKELPYLLIYAEYRKCKRSKNSYSHIMTMRLGEALKLGIQYEPTEATEEVSQEEPDEEEVDEPVKKPAKKAPITEAAPKKKGKPVSH